MAFDIEKLSLEELFDLNKRVVRRIQYLNSLKTRAQLDKFEVGDASEVVPSLVESC